MNERTLQDFARRYTAAWCSQQPESVAAFFSPDGSLSVNDGPAAVGRAAITQVAASFMSTFPDLQVQLDEVELYSEQATYHWTLVGTALTGKRVRISGQEEWTFAPSGLIDESKGQFDADDYARQLG